MFNLAEIKDTIKIEPAGFRKKKAQAITDEINRKYANKVRQDPSNGCIEEYFICPVAHYSVLCRIENLCMYGRISRGQVLQDVGLCVAMYDILYASEGFINHGDGCSYVTVQFRMVIFRPFIGEVLTGKIRSSNQEGVRGISRETSIRSNTLQEKVKLISDINSG